MSRRLLAPLTALAVLGTAFLAPAAHADPDDPATTPDPGPVVTSVNTVAVPATGGTTVTVAGTGFSERSTVRVGGRAAVVRQRSADSLTVVLPQGQPGTQSVVVEDEGRTSPADEAAVISYQSVIPGDRPKASRAVANVPAVGPFEDANLALCVTDALGLKPGTEPTATQLTGLDELFCTGRRVTSLVGIEQLKGLTTLDVGNNELVDLTPLAGLTGLTDLGLQENRITDLRPVQGLVRLTRLDLWSNPLTSVAAVSGLGRLTRISLDDTGITSLAPLRQLTALRNLTAGHTGVTDLSPLSGLTALVEVGLWRADVADASPLAGLTRLITLDLGSNRIASVQPLSRLTALTALTLENNQIRDLTPLTGLTGLYSLKLSNNRVDQVRSLSGMTKMQWLELDGNRISDLSPVKGLPLHHVVAANQRLAIAVGCSTPLRLVARNGSLLKATTPSWASHDLTKLGFSQFGTAVLGFSSPDGQFSGTVVASCSNASRLAQGDSTGDLVADLYAVKAGRTTALRGSTTGGLSFMTEPWQELERARAIVQVGDLNRDNRADLLVQRTDGTLWSYASLGNGYVRPLQQIGGSGWAAMDTISWVGNLGGGTTNHVLARRASDGALFRYTVSASGGLVSPAQIGSGWRGFTRIMGIGDWNKDGKGDLVGVRTDGALMMYPGRAGGLLGMPARVGQGWSSFATVFVPGGLSGDRTPDLVAVGRDGSLTLYPNRQGSWGASRQVGRGFTGWVLG